MGGGREVATRCEPRLVRRVHAALVASRAGETRYLEHGVAVSG
ncbi:hypothetical protein [Actinokineospora fastidiosa]|nr:hypothetical protein [Actinokineospora fastidiosa]